MSEKKERKSLQSPVGIATFEHLEEPFAFRQAQPSARTRHSVILVFDAEGCVAEMKALKRLHQGAADRFKLDFDEIRSAWRCRLNPASSSRCPWRKCFGRRLRTVRRPFDHPARR